MKVVAFGASNSRQSINKQLASYAARILDNSEIEILDLNDYELPLFSVDKEQAIGQPSLAVAFLEKISWSDVVIISFAEHNGSYSAAYKNLFDWCSRIENKVFQGKKMLLLATSPGKRGGESVLELAASQIPRFGGEVLGSFSLPSFNQNFDVEKKEICDKSLNDSLRQLIGTLID